MKHSFIRISPSDKPSCMLGLFRFRHPDLLLLSLLLSLSRHCASVPSAKPAKMTSTKVYGPIGEIRPFLDHSITMHYLSTIPDQGGKIIAEYVWIGGTGADLRSKARTLAKMPTCAEELPHWNYDGSSTGQAPGTDSEVYLIPRAIFRCATTAAAAAVGVETLL